MEGYQIKLIAGDFDRLLETGVKKIIGTDSAGKHIRRPNLEMDKYLAASDMAGVALLGIQDFADGNGRLRQEDAGLRARLGRSERFMEAFLE